jgi:hypothetical protein
MGEAGVGEVVILLLQLQNNVSPSPHKVPAQTATFRVEGYHMHSPSTPVAAYSEHARSHIVVS